MPSLMSSPRTLRLLKTALFLLTCFASFIQEAAGKERHDFCLHPRNPGVHCRSRRNHLIDHLIAKMWYYDGRSGRCQPILYFGCGGNYNRFQSKSQCQSLCFNSPSDPQIGQYDNFGKKNRYDVIRNNNNNNEEDGMDIETILGLRQFRRYESCFNHLQPDYANDLPESNHMAEFDDIISLRGKTFRDSGLGSPELWPNGIIPYEISPRLSLVERHKIACVIMMFQEKTCIKFRPKQSSDRDYMYLTSDNFGCYSDTVGQKGGRHVINLDRHHSHCWLHGTIAHEFMHALGFYHEHAREDRDLYVKLHWGNIESSNEENCLAHEFHEAVHVHFTDRNEYLTSRQRGFFSTNIGVYDYKSVMHYPRIAAGKLTMSALKEPIGTNNAAMGNRRAPTGEDIWKINNLYQCQGKSGGDEYGNERIGGRGSGQRANDPIISNRQAKAIDEIYYTCASEPNGVWSQYSGSCFRWNDTQLSWYDSVKYCAKSAPDRSWGRLAWIEDADTLRLLQDQLKDRHLWIGLKSIRGGSVDYERDWRFMSPLQIPSENTPFDPKSEGVSVLLSQNTGECMMTSKNVWWDYQCTNGQGFLCEYIPEEEEEESRSSEEESGSSEEESGSSEEDSRSKSWERAGSSEEESKSRSSSRSRSTSDSDSRENSRSSSESSSSSSKSRRASKSRNRRRRNRSRSRSVETEHSTDGWNSSMETTGGKNNENTYEYNDDDDYEDYDKEEDAKTIKKEEEEETISSSKSSDKSQDSDDDEDYDDDYSYDDDDEKEKTKENDKKDGSDEDDDDDNYVDDYTYEDDDNDSSDDTSATKDASWTASEEEIIGIRLVGGTTNTRKKEKSGRIEVFLHGRWGTVCSDGWTQNNAKVACKQLGYKRGEPLRNLQGYSKGKGPIWMDDVKCRGAESDLFECPYNFDGHNCSHRKDAGVKCSR